MYEDDSIDLAIRPDIHSVDGVIFVPSGTLGQIQSVNPQSSEDKNWFEITIIKTGIHGWVEQSHFAPLAVQNENYFEEICPNAGGYHFAIGQRFIVPFGGGASNIRAQPNKNPIIGNINEGESGYILDGPVCKAGQLGNLLAWYVEADTGLKGWISEGYLDSNPPWIVPLPIFHP